MKSSTLVLLLHAGGCGVAAFMARGLTAFPPRLLDSVCDHSTYSTCQKSQFPAFQSYAVGLRKLRLFETRGNLGTDSPDGGAWSFIKKGFSKSGMVLRALLRNPSYRQELSDMITIRWSSVFRNLRTGELGRRGEEWLVAQMVLLTFILLGINPIFVFFIRLMGLGVGGFGAYMMIRAAWILKENLSPFPVPVENHYLVTSDLYDIVRHPLYGGLILVCVGVSLITNSCDRLIFTIALAALLGSKADREEEELATLHPGMYLAYVQSTKQKFIPYCF